MKRLFFAAGVAICSIMCSAQLKYYDASTLPLLGTLAPDAKLAYTRLPDSLENVVRKELWDLGKNSAGLAVRFKSDSPTIGLKWKSRNKFNMSHMTAVGIRGLDLYALMPDSTWRTVSAVKPSFHSHYSEQKAVTDMTPGVMREYMVYLSLYDGVDSLYIGVDSSYVVLPPTVDLPKRDKPIVAYGTSILQGGCASRPGMAHTNIMQRDLQRDVVNLGFSGNARLDPEIAHFMSESDAGAFIIDPLPNCKTEAIDDKMDAFLDIIREKHPETPIILVESPWFPIMEFSNEVKSTLKEKNEHLNAIYNRRSAVDNNLYYYPADKIILNSENTVDNYHFTDQGFADFAHGLEKMLKNL